MTTHSRLAPCRSCSRHVRREETACPFCGAPFLAPPPMPTRVVSERMTRAALMTLGAAVLVGAAATLDGCATPTYGAPDSGEHYDAGTRPDVGTSAAIDD